MGTFVAELGEALFASSIVYVIFIAALVVGAAAAAHFDNRHARRKHERNRDREANLRHDQWVRDREFEPTPAHPNYIHRSREWQP